MRGGVVVVGTHIAGKTPHIHERKGYPEAMKDEKVKRDSEVLLTQEEESVVCGRGR